MGVTFCPTLACTIPTATTTSPTTAGNMEGGAIRTGADSVTRNTRHTALPFSTQKGISTTEVKEEGNLLCPHPPRVAWTARIGTPNRCPSARPSWPVPAQWRLRRRATYYAPRPPHVADVSQFSVRYEYVLLARPAKARH